MRRAPTLTKRELADLLSRKSPASRHQVEEVVRLFLEAIVAVLKNGGEVRLIPFGTFAIRTRKAFRSRNPRTGERIMVQETRIPIFRPGKLLRQAMK